MFHFNEMLHKRNAYNVKSSVSFTFRRGMEAEQAMFIDPCDSAMYHTTHDNTGQFFGVNIHGVEHCDRGFGFITRDTK